VIGSVLWNINVYDRFNELHEQVCRIRTEFKEAKIFVASNSPLRRRPECKEDFFTWFPNRGHHVGTIDALNAAVPFSHGFDFIISTHADAILSDYSRVQELLTNLSRSHREVAFISTWEDGCFQDREQFGVPLDFFVTTGEAYRRLFPLRSTRPHAETTVGCAFQASFDRAETLWLSTQGFDRRTGLMRYSDVGGYGFDVVSFHDRKETK
jgi:hypothetical protein